MGYSGLAKQRTVTLQRKDDREFGACAVAWRLHARAEFAAELGSVLAGALLASIELAAKNAGKAMMRIFCIPFTRYSLR
jgi:hypothetical protein